MPAAFHFRQVVRGASACDSLHKNARMRDDTAWTQKCPASARTCAGAERRVSRVEEDRLTSRGLEWNRQETPNRQERGCRGKRRGHGRNQERYDRVWRSGRHHRIQAIVRRMMFHVHRALMDRSASLPAEHGAAVRVRLKGAIDEVAHAIASRPVAIGACQQRHRRRQQREDH